MLGYRIILCPFRIGVFVRCPEKQNAFYGIYVLGRRSSSSSSSSFSPSSSSRSSSAPWTWSSPSSSSSFIVRRLFLVFLFVLQSSRRKCYSMATVHTLLFGHATKHCNKTYIYANFRRLRGWWCVSEKWRRSDFGMCIQNPITTAASSVYLWNDM